MNYPGIVITSLALLACGASVQAEIYETTDAEGTPTFTDDPGNAKQASEVKLQQTNVADAPVQIPDTAPGKEAVIDTEEFSRQAPVDGDPSWPEVDRRKDRDSSTPREVLNAEPRHEVMDAQPRVEVMDTEPRHEVMDAESRHEVMDAEPRVDVRDAQPRREVGDF